MKKLFVSLFLGLLVVGCAKTERVVVQGKDGVDGKDGVSCVASDEIVDGKKIGARVTCGNTFALILNGTDGADGTDGVDGKDAISISGSVATTSECATGGYVLTVGTNKYTVCNGLTGATGPQGPKGDTGEAGSGVTPVLLCNNEYGLKIGNQVYAVFHKELSTNQIISTSGVVNNGNDHTNGHTHNVTVPVSSSNTYLALLAPGPYVTTDGTNCSFTVNNDGTVTK